MIERPPLVAEAEWQYTGQSGAAYAHTYYPAFIDAPASSCFIAPIHGKPIYIHLVRQLRALEVTDFDNSLGDKQEGIRRIPVIRKPIRQVRINSVTAYGRDTWGGSGLAFAQEIPITGRIFRNLAFTEVIVGWEVRDPAEREDLSLFYRGLRRLLFTYRYLAPDLRAKLAPALRGQLPAIRLGGCTYSGHRATTAIERLRDNEPQSWHVKILSIADHTSVPFLKWSYKKRCTNAIVGVPIGGSWLWRVNGSSWLRKRLKN